MREVGQRLGLYPAALPVRAAQKDRLVDLVLVVPTGRDHMDRTTTPSHEDIPPLQLSLRKLFSAYTQWYRRVYPRWSHTKLALKTLVTSG